MALTWKDFVEAWRIGAINNDASPIDAIITDDFMWETSDMDRQATIDWVNSTDFRVTEVMETLYENDDVIVGTHGVHGEGHDNMVMGVAYLRDGKVYRYHHQRKMLKKLQEVQMAKGYLVANIRVTDPEKFAKFQGMAAPAIAAHGGTVLAKGPGADRHEGDLKGVVMMIEFESKQRAEEFYYSDDYQAAKAVRDECAETDLMIIEGL